MYTEQQIDKLIQPLLINERKKEALLLTALADRLAEINTLLPSDIQTLINIRKNNRDVKWINSELSRLSKLSEKEIKSVIKEVAGSDYAEAKPFYDYREKAFIPFEENITLQRQIQAIELLTLQDFENISNTTAFMLRDFNNPRILIPTDASKAYTKLIDYAITAVTSGLDTYNTAISDVIQTLIDKGITAVEYNSESGKTRRVRTESAVKSRVLDGIRQVQQSVQDVIGQEIGSDGVEISVHNFSAPDHEPFQGHMFTNAEYDKLQTGQDFTDTYGIHFGAVDRPIGMWNCRHFVFRILLEHTTPNYTLEQLEKIKQTNADGITYKDKNGNNVTYSKYWCTQKRNLYELDIRKAKEKQAVAEKAFNTQLADKWKSRVMQLQNDYTAFCRQAGISPRYTNLRIFV